MLAVPAVAPWPHLADPDYMFIEGIGCRMLPMKEASNIPFPVQVKRTARGLRVTFVDIPLSSFVDPFVHETIERNPDLSRTELLYPWEKLANYLSANYGAKPVGLILHPARVGSTLALVCLRQIAGLAAYSEPTAINDLLEDLLVPAQTGAWRPEMIAALRFIVDLIGQHAGGPFVVKLRSWNSIFAPLVQEAFPETPWVFVVRNPIEVGVSIERKPPTWMRAYATAHNPFLPFAAAHGDTRSVQTYFAAMFATFCDAVGDIDHRHGKIVHYENLPTAVWESICPHFGIMPTAPEIDEMRSVARFDVKRGGVFCRDAEKKQAAASERLREAARLHAMPALHRLYAFFNANT